ncbi:MAG: peptide chain release factor 1 [Rhodospirillales bacterium]|nr:peptide chain release factor 1 [Rhodospirillales bacterium]MCB9965264.1 peptide chain release factor 1 [Rhodospirillales bacterium]MCB9972966.1 peptide chain release factor 1 [Rhodospirillales bacterium]MCB9980046.1 peptide chain release factor 1 [Rhodospirillales bacterium]
MSFLKKLAPLKARHEELASLMAQPDLTGDKFVKLSKEYADLSPIVAVLDTYEKALREQDDLKDLLKDPDMKDMAQEESLRLNKLIPELEHQIKLALIPKDEADTKNAILEIRAGTGGDEAALFAADLYGMYKGYATTMGWQMSLIEASESEIGGYKQISCEIKGSNVFSKLKFESGAHRVQRVPKTETQGRIHTSAATVAVLPEAEEVDIQIDEARDLRIDTYRSQGAGGQHVNTTDSAVRITHIPTGIVVEMQDERSQHKNRAKAMTILRSRLYEQKWREQQEVRAADRKSQVGTGDRSERIRTYNFPQGRVTDHRINLTLYKLDDVISGMALGEIIDSLIAEDQASQLAEIE